MKRLFSKLMRKLGAATETPTHPDFDLSQDWASHSSDWHPQRSVTDVGLEADEPADTDQGSIEHEVHPDLHPIDPQHVSQRNRVDPRMGAPAQAGAPFSEDQPVRAREDTQTDAASNGSATQKWHPPTGSWAQPTAGLRKPTHETTHTTAAEEFDDFPAEVDDLGEQDEELWQAALSYEFDEQVRGVHVPDTSFDVSDFDEMSEFGRQEIENEAESAQWEDLIDLELYEEDPEAPVDQETTPDLQKLDEYAARLVSQLPSIRLAERVHLKSRLKAVLEEFPFSASYRALAELVISGNSIEEIEDACELKCLWRDSPWLWSHRRFNRMQRSWQTEESLTYRSALTWKLAMELIRRFGRVEAERNIFEDWLDSWLQMHPERMRDGERMDPRFWSYPAFLYFLNEGAPMTDDDTWYYEEPIDIHSIRSFRIQDGEDQIWRFEPKDHRCDTGLLSVLPISKRLAEKDGAQAREVERDD